MKQQRTRQSERRQQTEVDRLHRRMDELLRTSLFHESMSDEQEWLSRDRAWRESGRGHKSGHDD
ncbi:hypothetical protein [uncultured Abyssibacter sp.]|uniref:hypothetical protein n=1 Tax=uncultured Abyssibacter sp. TaxID=2320202 RepID=UPI0032B15C9A